MKKYISLILSLSLLLLSLCSCQIFGEDPWEYEEKEKEEKKETEEKEKPLAPFVLEVPVEIEGVASLELVKVSTESKVRGSMGGGLYYENSTAGNVYIDAVFNAVNLSDENKAPDELFKGYAVGAGDKKYGSVLCCVEINGNADDFFLAFPKKPCGVYEHF